MPRLHPNFTNPNFYVTWVPWQDHVTDQSLRPTSAGPRCGGAVGPFRAAASQEPAQNWNVPSSQNEPFGSLVRSGLFTMHLTREQGETEALAISQTFPVPIRLRPVAETSRERARRGKCSRGRWGVLDLAINRPFYVLSQSRHKFLMFSIIILIPIAVKLISTGKKKKKTLWLLSSSSFIKASQIH